jgi:hypothetical protein
MPQTSTPRSSNIHLILRQLSIIAFPPAFILLFAHGIASGNALPAIGIVPLAASAVLGLLLLYRDHVAAVGSSIQALTPSNIFALDVFLAVVFLFMLIPSWIFITWGWNRSLIVLGTYGTVFMMVNW